jgi:hypothetical protein
MPTQREADREEQRKTAGGDKVEDPGKDREPQNDNDDRDDDEEVDVEEIELEDLESMDDAPDA